MKILITGGAGFIGSNIVDTYIAEGHEVIVVDNLSFGKKSNINPRAKFYNVDIRSTDLEQIFLTEKPEVVNHHAAQKSVPHSIENPKNDADINLMGLLNLLDLCVKYDTRKIIFASSGGALSGNVSKLPAKEDCEPSLVSPYAITKYMSEKYLHFYSLYFDLSYVSLRYANVYGPRQIAEGECGVLPIFMNNILNKRPSELFTYEDMPKGTSRDYVFVKDISRANSLALTKGHNEIINIGTGIETYVSDLYELLLEITNDRLPLIKKKERTGDVPRSSLDNSKAKKVLGWDPTISLRDGIALTYKYFRNNCLR